MNWYMYSYIRLSFCHKARRWSKRKKKFTHRLKCSRIRSSRMFSGRFPTHKWRVSLTILLRTLHLGSDVVVSFGGTVQRHTTSPDSNHGTLSPHHRYSISPAGRLKETSFLFAGFLSIGVYLFRDKSISK